MDGCFTAFLPLFVIISISIPQNGQRCKDATKAFIDILNVNDKLQSQLAEANKQIGWYIEAFIHTHKAKYDGDKLLDEYEGKLVIEGTCTWCGKEYPTLQSQLAEVQQRIKELEGNLRGAIQATAYIRKDRDRLVALKEL